MATNKNTPFLNDFQNSLDRLSQLNAAITKNTENKTRFTGFVLDELEKLHAKIKAIVIKIKEIKGRLDLLEGQVTQNTNGIQSKDAEITSLKETLDRLTAERDQLTTQLNESNKNASENSTALQSKIDENEATMRVLDGEKSELIIQRDALKKELSEKGDAQKAHADALQQVTDENTQKMAEMATANEAQMKGLQDQIAVKEAKIQEITLQIQQLQKDMEGLNQQIAEKDARLQGNAKEIEDLKNQIAEKDKQINETASNNESIQQEQNKNASAIAECSAKIQQLEGDRNALQAENDDLIERIKRATIVINEATQQLEELTNQGFYEQSNKDVLQKISEIETTLKLISETIEGNVSSSSSNNVSIVNSLLPMAGPRNRNINVKGINMNLNDLMTNLMKKNKDVVKNTGDTNNKYQKAYKYINDTLISSPAISDKDLGLVVENGMKGIDFTSDGSVRGGFTKASRKHKKRGKKFTVTRKQKGGFTWGKYKKTTTNAPATKSTSSLTNSSGHSRKKYKMNRARGLTKRRK